MITAADLAPSLNAAGRFFLVGCEPEEVWGEILNAALSRYAEGTRAGKTARALVAGRFRSFPSPEDEGVYTWAFEPAEGFACQVDVVYSYVDLYGASGKRTTLVAAGMACDPTSSTERLPMNVLERLVRGGRAYWTRDYHRPALALSCDLYTAVWLELKPYVDYSGKLVHPNTNENLPIIADWLEEYGHPAVHCRLFLALRERISNSAWNPR